MSCKTTISITEARKKIFNIADEIQNPSVYYTLTERGKPKAVIMSAEEFESWQETMEVVREFPDLKKDIAEAEKDYQSGNYTTLDKILAKEGYIINDKGKDKYAISSCHSKKSRKKIKKTR